jgi:hypothetical protein
VPTHKYTIESTECTTLWSTEDFAV